MPSAQLTADASLQRVQGVALDNGDEIRAPLVVTTLHPRTAFLDQIPRHELPEDFVNDIAKTLALGPGAKTPDDLLAQKSLAHPDRTLGELKADLFNRMREVFELSRICRIDAPCGGYAHHDGSKAALVEVTGNTTGPQAAEVAKDVAMHAVALAPQALSKEDLDPAVVAKEREILSDAARKEGKPENIIGKMIEGRLRNFFSQCVLLEQPFVKDDKQTVG
jgi:elongation factor Ts